MDGNLSVISVVIVKKGENEIPGLTDNTIPRRLGPKRASKPPGSAAEAPRCRFQKAGELGDYPYCSDKCRFSVCGWSILHPGSRC